MSHHQHVMYASKSTVKQVYSELYGDVDAIEIEQGSSTTGIVRGKFGTFVSYITGSVSGEITRSEIHSINFDDEMLKAKRLANELLSDEEIPRISEVGEDDLEPSQLYRFSCEVLTKPFKSGFDDETYIEVSGEKNGIRFRGDTSNENWGNRSHIIQSLRAAKHGESYPYQGLVWPVAKTGESETVTEYDVKFVVICGPERELRERWYDKVY